MYLVYWAVNTTSISDAFWKRVNKSYGCWEWGGPTTKKGYGRFSQGQRTWRAHRLAYELTYGPFPTQLQVLHHCDNPPCVRPEHLFLGDHAANMADAVAKGRLGNQTHCKQGHALSGDNEYSRPDGSRECRTCRRARRKEYYRKTHTPKERPQHGTYNRGMLHYSDGEKPCPTCRVAVAQYQRTRKAASRARKKVEG